MSKTILFLLLISSSVFGQGADQALKDLTQYTDQFDKPFSKAKADELIIIYVSGADDPFTKVYDKWKGKEIKNPSRVQVVGGFKEMLTSSGHGGSNTAGMKKHVQEAMVFRYGDKHFPILIDMESTWAAGLKVSGLSVITISRKINKVDRIDFGTDRKKFFDAIKPYFNE
jgi:hypothetical protein